MKHKGILILAIAAFAAAPFALLQAGEDGEEHVEKMVIALKTDEFELEKTDVSHLGIGDAETIYTESGKTIDLLRTEDGIEIYVDGELLDVGAHGGHGKKHKIVKIVCDEEDGEDCEKHVKVLKHGDLDLEELHHGDHEVIVIKKQGEEI